MTIAIIRQKDLLTKRWRNVEAVDPSELSLQIRLVDFLRQRLRPDVVWFHPPNGEYRDKRTAARLKAMGVRPGVADLVFIWARPGAGGAPIAEVLFLELKRRGGKLTDAQHQFWNDVQWAGAHYRWADNFAAAVDIVRELGLLADYP